MVLGKFREWRKVVIANKIRECLAPIVTNSFRLRRASSQEFRQVRNQVIAAALLKLCR